MRAPRRLHVVARQSRRARNDLSARRHSVEKVVSLQLGHVLQSNHTCRHSSDTCVSCTRPTCVILLRKTNCTRRVQGTTQRHSVEKVMSLLLGRCKEIAERYLDREVHNLSHKSIFQILATKAHKRAQRTFSFSTSVPWDNP